MRLISTLRPLLLLAVGLLAGCDGVETGAVSPCHGTFRAQGQYFRVGRAADGSTVVLSSMSAPVAGCGD